MLSSATAWLASVRPAGKGELLVLLLAAAGVARLLRRPCQVRMRCCLLQAFLLSLVGSAREGGCGRLCMQGKRPGHEAWLSAALGARHFQCQGRGMPPVPAAAPHIPIVSEENRQVPYETRKVSACFSTTVELGTGLVGRFEMGTCGAWRTGLPRSAGFPVVRGREGRHAPLRARKAHLKSHARPPGPA